MQETMPAACHGSLGPVRSRLQPALPISSHHSTHRDAMLTTWFAPPVVSRRCNDGPYCHVAWLMGHVANSQYARLALKRGQVDQAVEVALRVLVHRPSGTDAHKLVSDCLASAEGLEACERKLSGREGADAAFAFVANAVKQAGGVDAASRLAWASLKENPGCPGHALALMHVLELQFRYRGEAARARLCGVNGVNGHFGADD